MCFFRTSLRFFAGASILLACGATAAQTPGEISTVWIAEFLNEFSQVQDAGAGHGKEMLATHLALNDQEGIPSLVYERTVYDSDRDRAPTSHQIIHYPCTFADLDADSLDVMSWNGARSRDEFWVVTVRITPGKGPIEYTNVVEDRRPDGTVEVTSSRSRVSSLALGYFESEDHAHRLADTVAKLIVEKSAAVAQPETSE